MMLVGSRLCDDGVNEVVDSTFVLLTDETDVTLLTPASTPGVLDQPVLLIVVNTVTNKKNTVVKILTTESAPDTTKVELPKRSIDTNRERTEIVKGSDHSVISAVDCTPVLEVIESLALVVVASVFLGLVGILLLSGHTILDSITQSIGHKTTSATLITALLTLVGHALMITINKLLLRKNRKFTMSNLVHTLHIANNRESPAAAAATLILNRSHSTLSDPVLLLRIFAHRLLARRKEFTTREVPRDWMKISSSKLLRSKISKLVESKAGTIRVVLILLVQAKNSLPVLGEDFHTPLILS